MNILQANFKENDIPYSHLSKIGYSKEDIIERMKKEDLAALITGKRTSLLKIKGTDEMGQDFSFFGKLSLKRENDSVKLRLHPVREQILNDIGLNEKELNKLRKNQSVVKQVDGERCLIQLDRETLEILRTKTKNLNIPTHIQNTKLTPEEKEKLRLGQKVELNTANQKIVVGIDLNNNSGISRFDKEFSLKQQIAYDFHNPHIIGTIQTDRNSAEFVDSLKKSEVKQTQAKTNKIDAPKISPEISIKNADVISRKMKI